MYNFITYKTELKIKLDSWDNWLKYYRITSTNQPKYCSVWANFEIWKWQTRNQRSIFYTILTMFLSLIVPVTLINFIICKFTLLSLFTLTHTLILSEMHRIQDPWSCDYEWTNQDTEENHVSKAGPISVLNWSCGRICQKTTKEILHCTSTWLIAYITKHKIHWRNTWDLHCESAKL